MVGTASNNQGSSWLNPKMLECRCVTNIEWQLHDLELSGDAYISGPSFSYIVPDRIFILYTIDDSILRLSRDQVREKFMARLKRDANPLPTLLSTDIEAHELLGKHLYAQWMTETGNRYAQFSGGEIDFEWE
jgi:hypothetical protein